MSLRDQITKTIANASADTQNEAVLIDYQPHASYQIEQVRIDNLTGCFLYLDSESYYIPPFTVGVVVRLFRGSSRLSLRVKWPFPSPPNNQRIGGAIFVQMYDDQTMLPSAGIFAGNYVLPSRPGVAAGAIAPFDVQSVMTGAPVPVGGVMPLFYGDGFNANGTFERIEARQLIQPQTRYLALAAGVTTQLFTLSFKRIMYVIATADVAGKLDVGDDNYGVDAYFTGYIAAGIPVVVPMYGGNGYNANGATFVTARHSVGANVGVMIGTAIV